MNHDRTHDPTRSLKDAMKNIGEEEKSGWRATSPADSTGKVSHFKTPHEEVTIVSIAPADSTHKVDRFKDAAEFARHASSWACSRSTC